MKKIIYTIAIVTLIGQSLTALELPRFGINATWHNFSCLTTGAVFTNAMKHCSGWLNHPDFPVNGRQRAREGIQGGVRGGSSGGVRVRDLSAAPRWVESSRSRGDRPRGPSRG